MDASARLGGSVRLTLGQGRRRGARGSELDTLKAGPQQGRGHGGRADTSVASSAVSCWRFDEDGLKGRLRPSPSLSGPGTLRGCRLSDTAFRSTFRVSSVRPASRCR
ncbi:MAG: hypothetical protein ACPIOQ_64650, partial [Promethearchaeia archaeon]